MISSSNPFVSFSSPINQTNDEKVNLHFFRDILPHGFDSRLCTG